MTCQTPQQIIHLLYHSDDAAALDSLFEHIKTCPTCTRLIENLSPQPAGQAVEPSPASRSVPMPLGPHLARIVPQDGFFMNHRHLKLVRELGAGSMGRVYECVDTRTGRLVALKLINRDKATPGMISRIQREARIQAQCNHPNIVRLLETGSDDGIPYLVMEHVSGGNLGEFLKHDRFTPAESAACLSQIARGIAAAHALGVLHRDLKPANILLQGWNHQPGKRLETVSHNRLTPKVTDFGLAKLVDQDSVVTSTHVIVGTPAYMSPEQVTGSAVKLTPASDIYALGVIFYKLLTGHVPFAGDDHAELFHAIANRRPIAPRSLRTGIPHDLETICLKCLEKEPASRYRSANELADDLDRFLARQPIMAQPIRPLQKALRWMKANPLPAVSALCLLATILTLPLAAWFYANREHELKTLAERDRQQAFNNETIARQRAVKLQELVFQDMQNIRMLDYDLRDLRENTLAKASLEPVQRKIVDMRFQHAFGLISMPELLELKNEILVEAFYQGPT